MKRAFTLIEMLMVIAIIALLVGLMFPAMILIKDSSHGVACLNNLRQIGVAFHEYAGDNFDRFPPINLIASGGNRQWYTNLLDEGGYIPVAPSQWMDWSGAEDWGSADKGIWRCKSVGAGDLYWGGGYGMYHYQILNSCGLNPLHGATTLGSGVRLDDVSRPSTSALLLDAESTELTPGKWSSKISMYCPFFNDWDTDGSSRASGRHGRRLFTNVLFYDNHAAAVRWADLKANVNDIWRHETP